MKVRVPAEPGSRKPMGKIRRFPELQGFSDFCIRSSIKDQPVDSDSSTPFSSHATQTHAFHCSTATPLCPSELSALRGCWCPRSVGTERAPNLPESVQDAFSGYCSHGLTGAAFLLRDLSDSSKPGSYAAWAGDPLTYLETAGPSPKPGRWKTPSQAS